MQFPTITTLDNYAAYIISLVNEVLKEDPATRIILVCHSFGGIVGTRVGEKIAGKLHCIIFLCAYVVAKFRTMKYYASRDSGSEVVKHLHVNLFSNRVTIDHDLAMLRKGFYGDCSDLDVNYAVARICDEPLVPLITPVKYSDNFLSLQRFYIHTTQDKAISLPMQKTMVADVGGFQTYEIDSDHSPFFSHIEELEHVIQQIIEDCK